MPIMTGQDSKGYYYKWGASGKKYYYNPKDPESRRRAKSKAEKQRTAIYSSGYRE